MKTNEQKKELAYTHLFLKELTAIVLLHDRYTVSQHLAAIRRKKNHPERKDPHAWTSEELVKAAELHKEELDTEAALNKIEETEYHYVRIFNRNG